MFLVWCIQRRLRQLLQLPSNCSWLLVHVDWYLLLYYDSFGMRALETKTKTNDVHANAAELDDESARSCCHHHTNYARLRRSCLCPPAIAVWRLSTTTIRPTSVWSTTVCATILNVLITSNTIYKLNNFSNLKNIQFF